MKTTMKQKTIKMGVLLLGLRQRAAAKYLDAHGFSNEDLEEGWRLFTQVARAPAEGTGKAVDASLHSMADAFENRWFPIARLALSRRYPDVATALFDQLGRSSGKAATWNVTFFLERLQAMEKAEGPFAENGPAARALLTKRGLTAEVIAPCAAKMAEVNTMVPQDELVVSDQSRKVAEAAMLGWYNEWAGIARRVIPNRNVLRSLGLNRRPSTRDLEADEMDESPALPAGSAIEVRTLPPVVDAPGATPDEPDANTEVDAAE